MRTSTRPSPEDAFAEGFARPEDAARGLLLDLDGLPGLAVLWRFAALRAGALFFFVFADLFVADDLFDEAERAMRAQDAARCG